MVEIKRDDPAYCGVRYEQPTLGNIITNAQIFKYPLINVT